MLKTKQKGILVCICLIAALPLAGTACNGNVDASGDDDDNDNDDNDNDTGASDDDDDTSDDDDDTVTGDDDDDTGDDDDDTGDDDDDTGDGDDTDTSGGDDTDTGGGDDTDTGGGDDDDTDECNPPTWGSGFDVGLPVANWQLNGFWDRNGDGQVTTDDGIAETNLENILCDDGKKSVVLIIGDET